MAKLYAKIDEQIAGFIHAQHLFFVASAPLLVAGHVNVSPKGLDSLRILGPRSVAYLDLIGSGIETVAHLRENGRLVLMFMAFAGAPKILRLHGRGRVHEPGEPRYAELLPRFVPQPGARAIIELDVTRISDSCGFGVPLYQYQEERTALPDLAIAKGDAGLNEYRHMKNARSIDGLPGLRRAETRHID
ncbi:MAG: Pyridoxamine 5-phosphate oxidase [Myxococcaceae bacterium]|nr:Pyridoxamine 5-phosphate oxidase [Myxococcaceae bacterium]